MSWPLLLPLQGLDWVGTMLCVHGLKPGGRLRPGEFLWADGLLNEVEFRSTEGVSEATRQTTGSTGEIIILPSDDR